MSSTTISWTTTSPQDSDFVSSGASEIRSVKSNILSALSQEHDWVGGGPSGGHKLGSARVFVGPSSQVSSADTRGRLMFNSTLSQLVVLDSASSTIVGGRKVLHGPPSGGGWISGLTQYIGIDGNHISDMTNDSVKFTSFNHTFAAVPVVTVSLTRVTPDPLKTYAPYVRDIGLSGFTCYWGGDLTTSTSTASIAWIAIGPVAYP